MSAIDIIMPCYNAEAYVEESIASIQQQTFSDFRIICIDDASKDGTWEILCRCAEKDPRILVLKNEENRGIANTRNRGLAESTAEYVAFVDDDDLLPKERLERGKNYLDSHKEVGIVAGNYLTFDENGTEKVILEDKFLNDAQIRATLPFSNVIANGTTLIRNQIIKDKALKFHEEYGVEDYRFYTELSAYTGIHLLSDVFLKHRVMATQYSEVCTTQPEKLLKRKQSLENIHTMCLDHITENVREEDIRIYLRLVEEYGNGWKLKNLFTYLSLVKEISADVKKSAKADWEVFNKRMQSQKKSILRHYLKQKISR